MISFYAYQYNRIQHGMLFSTIRRKFFVYFKVMFNFYFREIYDIERFFNWLNNIKWTSEMKSKWEEFYKNGSRRILFGGSDHFQTDLEVNLPVYQDFQDEQC